MLINCTRAKAEKKPVGGGGGVEVWFPLRPHATDLLVSGTCRGGRVGRKNAVRGGSFKKKKSCTEKMGKGEMREENGSRGGRGARGEGEDLWEGRRWRCAS